MRSLVVAIQGERGSFSHEVAKRLFGSTVSIVACASFAELFSVTFGRNKRARAAIVPIENALYGSIHQNYDLLLKHKARICAEAFHRIEMCLIGRDKTPPKRGDTVLCHPVASGQCTTYLHAHKLNLRFTADTAGSVRELMSTAKDAHFAIASAGAAALYNAKIIARPIQDDAKNFTRFFVVTPENAPVTPKGARATKTAIACVLPNAPGSLFRALGAFALRDVDLAKLESRPIRGRPFEYMFYLEAQGSIDTPRVANAVAHLKELAEKVTVLGSYPSADPV